MCRKLLKYFVRYMFEHNVYAFKMNSLLKASNLLDNFIPLYKNGSLASKMFYGNKKSWIDILLNIT